ncbi:unnamed protein product [Bathycoccus prasinos]
MALTRSLLSPFSLSQMAEQGGRGGRLLLFRSSSSRTCGGKSAFNSILRGGGGFGRPSSKKAFSAQVARAESEQEGGGKMERQQQQQPEQRVSMTSSPMRGLLSRMLSDPYGGVLGPRRRRGGMMDTFLNDPFFRETDAITSSFLDSMIPKDTVFNMNQFDFLVDIVEKKDKFHLSGELPGCNVANVDVKVDKENNLHISAMKSIKHEEDEQSPDGSVKWHAIERSSGKVERIFALPEAADADKIDCSMKDGVLSIDIMKKPEFVGEPKKLEEKEMKKIPIKGA